MTTQATAMVLASFAADSLALGAHWIYDTDEIDRRIGRIENLCKPLPDSTPKRFNDKPNKVYQRKYCTDFDSETV